MPNSVDVSVTLSGPIFDNRLPTELEALEWAINDALGNQGVIEVHTILDDSLQHPTGYYRGHINYARADAGGIVSDDDVIYGSWLEGTSHRNETTRFKGYAAFRKATQELEAKATEIAQAKVDAVLGADL